MLWLCECVLPMFSYRRFIVFSLTFRSFLSLFLCMELKNDLVSFFFFLHMTVYFSKHHLLKRLSFQHCVVLLIIHFKTQHSTSDILPFQLIININNYPWDFLHSIFFHTRSLKSCILWLCILWLECTSIQTLNFYWRYLIYI